MPQKSVMNFFPAVLSFEPHKIGQTDWEEKKNLI